MISFEDNNNIPPYILERIKVPIESSSTCKNIISCKPIWGMIDHKEIQNIISSYENMDDKVIYIFLISDNQDEFIIPENVRLYRTSLLRSRQKDNEYLLPYVWGFVGLEASPLKKGKFPIVGFCGLNSIYRQKTLSLFMKNRRIKSNFIIRDKFWGGNPHNQNLIQEFEKNMIESHFNICNRGEGNFAIRFYQTLSCGRIPILLNTDIILPFEDKIKWRKIIIIADTEEKLVKKTLKYWNKKNIVKKQIKCKKIYDEYFANSKFFDIILNKN